MTNNNIWIQEIMSQQEITSGDHHHHQQQQHQQILLFPEMERVLFNLHYKCCTFVIRTTSRKCRTILEHTILVLAVCNFGALLLSHITFIYRHNNTNHSSNLNNNNAIPVRNYNNNNYIPISCLQSIPGYKKNTAVTHLTLIDDPISRVYRIDSSSFTTNNNTTGSVRRQEQNEASICTDDEQSDSQSFCDAIIENSNNDNHDDYEHFLLLFQEKYNNIYYSHSYEKGYILLSPELCIQHNIDVQIIQISKYDTNCFGEPFLQFLVSYILGHDTVMINWLLGTYNDDSISNNNNSNKNQGNNRYGGYIYNPRTNILTSLNNNYHTGNNHDTKNTILFSSMKNSHYESRTSPYTLSVNTTIIISKLNELFIKFAVVIKTCFLFFITTTLVSFTLRETQSRMLDFTQHLQEHVRSNRSIIQLVTTHVIENLVFVPIMVGMIFFLIEFYRGDKFLAFMVLSLVWICESFSVVSLRTKQGMHFFPRIFFLLFALFHFYHFSFPYGFSFLALLTSMCFMMHSMLFFWHRYELPAVVFGRVRPDHPRQGLSSTTSPSVTPTLQPDSGRNSPQQQPQILTAATTTTTTTPQPLPPPPVQLPAPQLFRTIGRTQSFNTTASDRISRNSSATGGMFNQGEEDDDDLSYMYFMNGEVVMHRQQQTPSPQIIINGVVDNENYYERTTMSSSSSDQPLRRNHWDPSSINHHRFVNNLEPVVASDMSREDDSDYVRTPEETDSVIILSEDPSSRRDERQEESDHHSALRTILSGMDDDPSTTEQDSDCN